MSDRRDRALDRLRDSALLDEDLETLASEVERIERNSHTGQSAFIMNWKGGQPRGVEIVEVQAQKVLTFKRRAS